MALDRHTKLELAVRTAFRKFISEQLATAKQKPVLVPGFEVPRGGNVDLVLDPKGGTVISLMQRSDYVVAYKHSVGQLIGVLAHYHEMKDRDIRDALRAAQAHPDSEELKQPPLNALKISKRLLDDRQAGEIKLALVTEIPEVPQQARELEANFGPIAELLHVWLPSAVKKQRLCSEVEFYAVDVNTAPAKVAVLTEAIKPLLKMMP